MITINITTIESRTILSCEIGAAFGNNSTCSVNMLHNNTVGLVFCMDFIFVNN